MTGDGIEVMVRKSKTPPLTTDFTDKTTAFENLTTDIEESTETGKNRKPKKQHKKRCMQQRGLIIIVVIAAVVVLLTIIVIFIGFTVLKWGRKE